MNAAEIEESKAPWIVVITGGAGRIAYSLIPLICNGSIFGNDRRIILRLVDIEFSAKKLEGIVMEIQDATFDLLDTVSMTINAEEGFSGAHVAILLGGYPRLPGMERKDLTAKNAEGMRDQAKALILADRDVKVLVVANPANTNTLVAMKSAPGIPQKNFTCLTRLDQERLRGFIAGKINSVAHDEAITAKNIKNVAIFGNHSTTQVPFLSASTVSIAGEIKNVSSFFDGKETLELIHRVQNRGGEVIKAQQASSALSAAIAIGKHLKDWITPEKNNDIFSMGILSDGNPYGIPEGLIYSFPCHHTDNGVQIVPNLVIDDDTRGLLDLSVKELQEEKTDAESMVGSLILTPSAKL